MTDGKTIRATGQVEFVTRDKFPIYRVQFTENGVDMEDTFIWQADPDKDGRICGYVYKKGYQGKKPGLETLFAVKEP